MELDKLRVSIQQAWEAVPEWYLESLIQSMHYRCLQGN